MVLFVFANSGTSETGNGTSDTANNMNFSRTNRGGTIFPNPRQTGVM